MEDQDMVRFIGDHPDHLEDGHPLVPGQEIPRALVDPERPKDKQLLDDGLLPDIPPAPVLAGAALKQRAKTLDVDTSGKTADEAREAVAAAEEALRVRAVELDINPAGKAPAELRDAIEQAEANADAEEEKTQ